METSSARGGARIISEKARKKLASDARNEEGGGGGRGRENFPMAYGSRPYESLPLSN